jgi:YegS/Rv2252/BmrU family lipid kinase
VPRVPEDKPLLVVNPAAGGGRCGRSFPAVREVVERRIGPVDVAATERPGHAIELSRSAANAGRARIVAVGGDGTLNEVVNGVLASDRSAEVGVGLVGQGTGGDFRRTLGIAHRLDAYVEALASGRERSLDVGAAQFHGHDGAPQRRWFLNILSVGMSGLVDRFVADSPRFLGGKAAYYLASVRALARCERARLAYRVSLGGSARAAEIDSYLLAICNGGYFGGGMNIAPMAGPDDGRFEVVSIDSPSKLAFPAYTRKIYSGGHLRLPGVTHFACDRIRIDLVTERAREAFLLDVDGEPLGGLPLEVEVVSKALRFLA